MPTVAPLDLDGYCLFASFIGEVPVYALADGTVHRLDHGHHAVEMHDGLTCAVRTLDGKALITGGEDGLVRALNAGGTAAEIGSVGRKWVSALAAGPQGAVGFSAGKNAHVRLNDGTVKDFAEERSIEGLAFAPKGLRLATARYNGGTLHWVTAAGQPIDLEWKGAHTAVMFSPDGKYVVTTMQENALHGWRLADMKHMRMSGYPAKVKSWSWSAKGKWLATSGAPAAIVWPFQGKDGPMGKAPLELGTRGDSLVSSVVCHPTEDIVAIGYADGMVLAVRFTDAKEILLRRGGKGPITSMTWDDKGYRIAFGSEAGDCGVIDIRG
ncbi:WD40 repeat domain-containing protein [Oricola cellulosilytica]|uniref:WD40 repeat domain-containing protein n=1 Tax=Oricola cellulosilytica TaxID=1429082 RepID=A0A4R0P626_9HYPH|nr:WD40 repeat domain-containing protein [Oricola cellulosilytica]TCD11358.1 WD40 repeat domain-containing protein [Oricola cellulosilytica]